jgi:hypothetical protein
MLKKIKGLLRIIREDNENLRHAYQLLVAETIDRLRKEERYRDPRSLVPFGYKVYSQNDEDGIIREIFNRIGTTSKIFVEFGVGNGLENNTLALLLEGWTGLWIEASGKDVRAIRENLPNSIGSGRLKVVESFITKKNIDDLISSQIRQREIDLLSIDIDGNDVHVLDAIASITPRVVVIEYNAKFVPPAMYCMEYDESYSWNQDDCVGCSLKFLETRLAEKGYCLVGCNLIGINAFFVRKDLVTDKFLEPFSAEKHYEQARYYLTFGFVSGHRPSYRTVDRSL